MSALPLFRVPGHCRPCGEAKQDSDGLCRRTHSIQRGWIPRSEAPTKDVAYGLGPLREPTDNACSPRDFHRPFAC